MLTWQETCTQLIRDVDPHFDGPTYLLDANDVDGATEASCGGDDSEPWIAVTGALSSLDLRHQIPDWNGPGFCAVYRVDRHRSWHHLEAVTLHEYAHFVEGDIFGLMMVAYGTATAVNDPVFEERTDSPQSERLAVPMKSRPWDGHGPAFVRLCCHLLHRANLRGWGLEASDVYQPGFYGLAGISAYLDVLGDEPERLAGLPMAEVSRMEPPEEFTAAAAGDVKRASELWD